jgi:molybdate transport system substrate-binding protein
MEQILDGRISRLAMGEPDAVPAGVYGRRFFERQGAWERLRPKVVPFPTVRAVLAAVEAGRVDAGVVYRTDAIDARVQVIASAADLDIVLPAAVIDGREAAEGRRFLEFLQGPQARAVFTKRGFGVRPVPSEPKRKAGRVEG